MGDGRIFLKTRRDVSFNKAYQMSPILAGSISLDSTFKTSNTLTDDKYKKLAYCGSGIT